MKITTFFIRQLLKNINLASWTQQKNNKNLISIHSSESDNLTILVLDFKPCPQVCSYYAFLEVFLLQHIR
jgi:hypothetical protein